VFRDPVFAVTVDPRATVESAVRELLRVLAELPVPPTLRVAEVDGGGVAWRQKRGWTLFLGSNDRNRVKRDCSLVATADALVVLGDPAPWERLLRLCREARIPARVFQTCPKLPPRQKWPAEE
jgi:hypothetical protein